LLFNFAWEYVIRNLNAYKKELELNYMYQILVYVGVVTIPGGNRKGIDLGTESATGVSKEVGLQVTTDKARACRGSLPRDRLNPSKL
jgi:hypothetical protein